MRFVFVLLQSLAESMTGISAHAKHGQLNDFCDSVARFANAVCGMVENAAQVTFMRSSSDLIIYINVR